MKNYWLKLHNSKSAIYWTAEFSKFGVYELKPRKVEVIDLIHNSSFVNANGTAVLRFHNVSANDLEFKYFLVASNLSMQDWNAKIRSFTSAGDELQCYEIEDMTYFAARHGLNQINVDFIFNFSRISHYNWTN